MQTVLWFWLETKLRKSVTLVKEGEKIWGEVEERRACVCMKQQWVCRTKEKEINTLVALFWIWYKCGNCQLRRTEHLHSVCSQSQESIAKGSPANTPTYEQKKQRKFNRRKNWRKLYLTQFHSFLCHQITEENHTGLQKNKAEISHQERNSRSW